MKPKVSFVIPCYKLAHLLPDCINSILCQTFANFEILIMDDCSPDNTAEVAASFKDDRVKHVRNDPNLGHLRNYNKGIALSRGEYVWLISADDYIYRQYAVQRYVDLMDAHPEVGFTFCPGVKIKTGHAPEILSYSIHGEKDRVFNGRVFLKKLLRENTIVAASGLVRRKCYTDLTLFPLDMPWGGDWYLWCVFALHMDVGYLAEPLVCYREHDLSMTTKLMKTDVEQCSKEDMSMPWILKRKVEEAGHPKLAQVCLDAAAFDYARRIAAKRYKSAAAPMAVEEFEQLLSSNTSKEAERDFIRARVYSNIADRYYWDDDCVLARRFYSRALHIKPFNLTAWAKLFLLAMGQSGNWLRRRRAHLREAAR